MCNQLLYYRRTDPAGSLKKRWLGCCPQFLKEPQLSLSVDGRVSHQDLQSVTKFEIPFIFGDESSLLRGYACRDSRKVTD